jgi:hypothetical protein
MAFSGLFLFRLFPFCFCSRSSLSVSLESLSLDSLELVSLLRFGFLLVFGFFVRSVVFFRFVVLSPSSDRSSLTDGSMARVLESLFSLISLTFVADFGLVTVFLDFSFGLQ